MKVDFRPSVGYEKRLSPAVTSFLEGQILGHLSDVEEAAAFVDTHRNMVVHVIWDNEGPEPANARESAIFWVAIDHAISLRFSIGSFDNYADGHSEEALIGTFSIKGVTDAYGANRRMVRNVKLSDPSRLLALIPARRD